MNPIVFALRHPYTVMVGVLAIVLGSVLALTRMKIDIFPSLNLPVIYVAQPYGGLDPAQMEGLITNYYEYHFLYVNGIHHVESKNVQGVALMKLYFHPGTDMAQAMAETVQYVNRSRAFMPPGTVGPFCMRFDTGSVPVGFVVAKSQTRSIGEIQDAMLFKVRPMFASLPGVSAPPPFGGNQRTVIVKLDPDRLRANSLSPDAVITALTSGNTISPSGTALINDQMPIVPVNAMVKNPKELGKIPIRPGADVYLRDIVVPNGIEDSTDIPCGYTLANGKRAVYLLVTKRADASTLSVVNEVKKTLPKMRAAIPEDIEVNFEFDQSPYVTGAMWGVAAEGAIGAALTGLMVLLFLRDWRSVIVVVLNIPFALLGSVVALWLTGQSVNIMTLGGLALAVGILVDEATVEVENIHTQFEHTPNIATAVRLGNAQTAVPRLLAMLCILAVFLPAFFMQGAAQALFVPMSLAVGFSMVTSYFLSSTFVPVLSVWLLRHVHPTPESQAGRFSFARFRGLYERALRAVMHLRWYMIGGYAVAAGLLIWLVGGRLGTDIFPRVDTGQFQLRLRAADGTRLDITEELAKQALEVINEEAGAGQVAGTVGYVGLIPTTYPINTIYLWMRGPEEALLRVALKKGSPVRVEELQRRLRQRLPQRLGEWLRPRLQSQGLTEDQVEQRVRALSFSFEPADIINNVMSFGSPTPLEIVVRGKDLAQDRDYAERALAQLKKVPSLRDLQFSQSLNYPTVDVKVDRERMGLSGVVTTQVSNSLVAATSSSRFVVPNFWADPATGIGYQVQVEVPPFFMNSTQRIGTIPIKDTKDGQILLRDMAQIRPGSMPGEYDRYNMIRVLSLTANIEGEDLGRVAGHVSQVLKSVNESLWSPGQNEQGKQGWNNAVSGEFVEGPTRPTAAPRGMMVEVRGQVVPMQEMFGGLAGGIAPPRGTPWGNWGDWVRFAKEFFAGLTGGLILSVVAIFLLLTAYFQSVRLALVSVSAVPAVIAGVAVALLLTGTTLNLQSFMGAIMAIGVAVANAILLTTFAEVNRKAGAAAPEAAVRGAESRLRPILMTSCAMLAGMIPMALAFGEGGEQTAPLARAVIGGLIASTLATLIVLPSVFAVVQGRSDTASASLDPADEASQYHDDGFEQSYSRIMTERAGGHG
jgi:multidrug efflux pump subunit AcrB